MRIAEKILVQTALWSFFDHVEAYNFYEFEEFSLLSTIVCFVFLKKWQLNIS